MGRRKGGRNYGPPKGAKPQQLEEWRNKGHHWTYNGATQVYSCACGATAAGVFRPLLMRPPCRPWHEVMDG